MEIWVEFSATTKEFKINPDPAIVKKGTPISWRFKADDLTATPRVRWIVYFQSGSPFGSKDARFSTVSVESTGQHTGATGTVPADDPGDYKYGVRAEDATAGRELGDDDPRLKVLS